MNITFKGRQFRVQFSVFDITNLFPEKEVTFSVQSLPITANPYRAFSTGNIHYHGENFSEAWKITCQLLQNNDTEIPKKLLKYKSV